MQITIPLKHVLPGYGIIRQTQPAALGLFMAQTLQAESQVSVSACKKNKNFLLRKVSLLQTASSNFKFQICPTFFFSYKSQISFLFTIRWLWRKTEI